MTGPRLPRWRHIRMYDGPRQKARYVARRLIGLDTPSADWMDAGAEAMRRIRRDALFVLGRYPEPVERMWGPFTYGVSGAGYGRWLRIGRRVSFASTGATTRMWPRVMLGGDENCNRSVTFVAWPLGHVDIWWEPRWRTEECADCKADRP